MSEKKYEIYFEKISNFYDLSLNVFTALCFDFELQTNSSIPFEN